MTLLQRLKLRLCFEYVALFVLWAVCIVLVGLLFRIMKELFCIGFTC